MSDNYINICQKCGEIFESEYEYKDLCESCEASRVFSVEKKCAKCSITYISDDPFSLYCPDCKADRELRCKICGTYIEKTSGNRRYCTSCARHMRNEGKKADRQHFRERQAAVKAAKKREQKRKARGAIGIIEAVKAAEKLGISYGQYMDKYR